MPHTIFIGDYYSHRLLSIEFPWLIYIVSISLFPSSHTQKLLEYAYCHDEFSDDWWSMVGQHMPCECFERCILMERHWACITAETFKSYSASQRIGDISFILFIYNFILWGESFDNAITERYCRFHHYSYTFILFLLSRTAILFVLPRTHFLFYAA